MKRIFTIAALALSVVAMTACNEQQKTGVITNADGTQSTVQLPQDNSMQTGILSGVAGFLLGRSMGGGGGVVGGGSAVASQPTTVINRTVNQTVIQKNVTVNKAPPVPKPEVKPPVQPKPQVSAPKPVQRVAPAPTRSYSSPARSSGRR